MGFRAVARVWAERIQQFTEQVNRVLSSAFLMCGKIPCCPGAILQIIKKFRGLLGLLADVVPPVKPIRAEASEAI